MRNFFLVALIAAAMFGTLAQYGRAAGWYQTPPPHHLTCR